MPAGTCHALAGTDSAEDTECVTYRGARFGVCHPTAFEVVPSLPSSTADGYDSARFVAPDESVSFYVYAPQWGGQATDIEIDTERYSMRSWGIAIDDDPARNRLKWKRDRANFAKPDYDAWWRFREEEGWVSLGRSRNYDWMHVQAARL